MDNCTFNQLIRPLNIQYLKLFGKVPRIIDYSCSREEYVVALEAAIKSSVPLSKVLTHRKNRYQIAIGPKK